MKSRNPPVEVSFSGKGKDVAFIVQLLRQEGISYRQVLGFSKGPVIRVPIAHEARLKALLEANTMNRTLYLVTPEEVESCQRLFWIMIGAVIGILSIAWGRVLFHHHR